MDVPPTNSAPPPPPPKPGPGWASQRSYNLTGKPGKLTVIIVLTLVSGVFNIFAALAGTAATVAGTFGIGLICCAPLTILPGVLGVFEILYAMDLMAQPPKQVRPNQTIAILEIVSIVFGNALAAIAGITALVLYSEPEVKSYFAWINR